MGLEKWDTGLPVESLKVVRLARALMTAKSVNGKLPFTTNIPIFHHSIMSAKLHFVSSARQELRPHKTPITSIGCRISETSNYL